jgi:hypothetical protein
LYEKQSQRGAQYFVGKIGKQGRHLALARSRRERRPGLEIRLEQAPDRPLKAAEPAARAFRPARRLRKPSSGGVPTRDLPDDGVANLWPEDAP